VAYGYPVSPAVLDEWEADDIVVGGCIIDEYASPYQCRNCGVGVWPHRMFHADRMFHIELATESGRADARAFFGALWVEEDDGSVLFIPEQDVETVLLGLLVEVVGDGEQFAGWLRYRNLPSHGEVRGMPTRFTVDDDTVGVHADAAGDVLTVPDSNDRLLLYLLRAFIVDRGVGLDGFTTWLDDLGIVYAKVGPDE
jgi:hypothetical protein